MCAARRRLRGARATGCVSSWTSSPRARRRTAHRSRRRRCGAASSARSRDARPRSPCRSSAARLPAVGCGIVPAMTTSPFSLEGKTAIITGGGTGIGKSMAIEFARAGADVAIASRKLEHLEPVAKEIEKLGKRAFAMAVDVRQEDQVQALVERTVKDLGRLDIMVNNAGASFRAKPEDISVNGWNTVIQINLNGVFLGSKWAGKQMMQQPTGGVIVNISSIAGVYGSTMMSHYGAAKSAVITLKRELGTAGGRQGL